MTSNRQTSALIDGLLQFVVAGGLLAVTLVAPNSLQVFDKPLKMYFEKMDARSRQREYNRLLKYMQRQGLVEYSANNYQHGIKITPKGKNRVAKADLENIHILTPKRWDHRWRIVFFDIPEKHKTGRDYLNRKLKQIGFVQLQKSVFVHPFPCRREIETITIQYNVAQYVTYVETAHIDSEDELRLRFNLKLK